MQPNYKRTKLACYAAIITQAVQNNLPPLLFVLFQEQFGISYEMLGRLILANFVTQMESTSSPASSRTGSGTAPA